MDHLKAIASQGLFREDEFSHRPPLDEMLLNNPFQHGRRDRVVPGAIGIHNCNRALLANAQAIRLGAVYGMLGLRQAQLLQAPLQIVP